MEMVLEESGDFAWSLLWSRAFLAALYAAGYAWACSARSRQRASGNARDLTRSVLLLTKNPVHHL